MGNTNFSVITPRALFTRNGGAELVARAVRERLNVPSCTVNERNDVVLRPDGTKEGELKVRPRAGGLTPGLGVRVQDHLAPRVPPRHDAHLVRRREPRRGAPLGQPADGDQGDRVAPRARVDDQRVPRGGGDHARRLCARRARRVCGDVPRRRERVRRARGGRRAAARGRGDRGHESWCWEGWADTSRGSGSMARRPSSRILSMEK